ncbi:MAG: hypothetical protein ACRBB6_04280 [Neptuniibacter sp.]
MGNTKKTLLMRAVQQANAGQGAIGTAFSGAEEITRASDLSGAYNDDTGFTVSVGFYQGPITSGNVQPVNLGNLDIEVQSDNSLKILYRDDTPNTLLTVTVPNAVYWHSWYELLLAVSNNRYQIVLNNEVIAEGYVTTSANANRTAYLYRGPSYVCGSIDDGVGTQVSHISAFPQYLDISDQAVRDLFYLTGTGGKPYLNPALTKVGGAVDWFKSPELLGYNEDLGGIVKTATGYWAVTNDATVFELNEQAQMTGITHDISGTVNSPIDICWDGTHFYVVTSDTAYQFDTNWAYTSQSFSIDGNTVAVTWDGTSFWSVDTVERVYQYNSSWVVQNGGSEVTDISAQTTDVQGMYWDGSYFWVLSGDQNVFRYTSAWAYDSFSIAISVTTPAGIAQANTNDLLLLPKDQGNYSQVVDTSDNTANVPLSRQKQYIIQPDVSGDGVSGICWDGTHYWVLNDNGTGESVHQYDTDFQLTGISYTIDVGTNIQGICWDGSNFWLVDDSSNRLQKFDSNWANPVNYAIGSQTGSPWDVTFDGTNICVTDQALARVHRYTTSGVHVDSVNIEPGNEFGAGFPYGIAWDGTHYWIGKLTGNGTVPNYVHIQYDSDLVPTGVFRRMPLRTDEYIEFNGTEFVCINDTNSPTYVLVYDADFKPVYVSEVAALVSLDMSDPTSAHVNLANTGDFTPYTDLSKSTRGPNEWNLGGAYFDGSSTFLISNGLSGFGTAKEGTFNCILAAPDTGSDTLLIKMEKTGNTVLQLAVDIANETITPTFGDGGGTSSGTAISLTGIKSNVLANISLSFRGSDNNLLVNFNGTNVHNGTVVDVSSVDLTQVDTIYVGQGTGNGFTEGIFAEIWFEDVYRTNLGMFWDSKAQKGKPLSQVISETGIVPEVAIVTSGNPGKNRGSWADFTDNNSNIASFRSLSEYLVQGVVQDTTVKDTNYLRLAIPSGVTDSTGVSFVVALKNLDTDTGDKEMFFSIGDRFGPRTSGAERIRMECLSTTGSDIVQGNTNVFNDQVHELDDTDWHIYLVSIDASSSFVLSNYHGHTKDSENVSGNLGTMDFTGSTDPAIQIFTGSGIDMDKAFAGAVGFLYVHTGFLDFAQKSVRDLFIDGLGYPRDLEKQLADGLIPNPIVCMTFDPEQGLGLNLGTAGDLTVTGTVKPSAYIG